MEPTVFALAALLLALPDAFYTSVDGGAATSRLFYASLVLLLLRDFRGCFTGNLTRRPAASVRKPLGYRAAFLRRPRWCPPRLLRLLCADGCQRCAFAAAVAGAAVAASSPDARAPLRVGVAAAYLVVELRFHAALGWHRDVLCAWTLVAEALPAGCRPTLRVLALAHSYGGSGYRRWRAGGGPDAAALRAVFEGATKSGNVVAPRLADIGRGLPDAALLALDGASRAGLEIFGVGFLIAGRRSPGVRGGFRAAAAAFHVAVGLATAIDFLENRVVLLAGFVGDDASAPVAAPSCSTLAARLYALALFLPVAAGCEHFPLTHNGLFPYSGSQMAALRRSLGRGARLVASAPGAGDVDLAAAFLGLGAAQPAQVWHPVLAPAALAFAETGDGAKLAADAATWLRDARPLVDPATGACFATAGFAYKAAAGARGEG